MPKGHKHGNLRQKNKPFKGNSKAKIEEKQSGIGGVRKKIKKTEKLLTKSDRKNKIQQQRKDKEFKDKESFKVEISQSIDPMQHETLSRLLKNQPSVPKIILLAPFNSAADTEAIKQNLASLLQGEDVMSNPQIQNSKISHEFNYKQLSTSNKISPELKTENYIFISCPRKKDVFLDYCKVADVVCMVLSCKDVEKEALVLDPHAHAKAFDQEGYDFLECLRSQGMPNIVGVLQDIEVLPQGKQNTVKKIYQRFYESEVGLDEKFVSLEKDARSYFTFLRNLQSLPPKQLGFREIRSYMMASKIEVDTTKGALEVTGFLKGTCLNSNQLVHVTGFGDFQVGRVEVLQNPFATERTKANLGALGVAPVEAGSDIVVAQNAEPTKMENLTQFYNNKNFAKVIENDATGPEESKEGGMEEEKAVVKAHGSKKPMDEMTIEEKLWDEMEGLAIEDQKSDVSYDERNDQSMTNLEEEKNRLKFKLRQRTDDEMEFVDEIDYNVDVQLKDRFRKYTGLKSFRTSEWNPYSALPPEFEKIIIFDNFDKTQRNAVAQANSEAFAVAGFYVKLYIMDFPLAQLQAHDKEKPFIVSSLLKYERKVSLLHMNVRRHTGATEEIRSKEQLEIHMGFRVFNSRPVFSKFFMNCQKVKMERKTVSDKVYMASMYGEVTYLPSNVLMFKLHENGARELVASGELQRCDPLKVILKRIILTGYPLKIHKRKAVVRMMFFNSIDVGYFSPIELVTKHRLKGHIKESLGTHGLMKCIFNNTIKANDTICLYLYKRVFPKWPFEQVDSSFNTVSADIKMM